MKNFLAVIVLLSAAVPAAAQSTPATDSLHALASGECPPERCFDGRPILRREPPLVILEETKVSEHVRSGYTEVVRRGSDCHYYDDGYYDDYHHGGHRRGGHYHRYRRCHDRYDHIYHPPALVSTWRQTVGVEDRERHVSDAKRRGGLWGGLIGLAIGALGFLAGPLAGLALMAGGAIAGAFTGAKIGGDKAARDPKVFDRSFTTERPLPPGGPQY